MDLSADLSVPRHLALRTGGLSMSLFSCGVRNRWTNVAAGDIGVRVLVQLLCELSYIGDGVEPRIKKSSLNRYLRYLYKYTDEACFHSC